MCCEKGAKGLPGDGATRGKTRPAVPPRAASQSFPPPRRRRAARWERSRPAFSLLEMMFVFVLIGLLAGLVTVNARYYLLKGKQNAARAEISSVCTALETFYSVEGRYPENDEGLEVLAAKSERFPEPLLKQPPRDPWGREYQYNRSGRDGEPYEVISFGADGRDGGEGADADLTSADLKGDGGAK